MRLWMLALLFALCIWGLFAKRDSVSGKAAGTIAVIGVVLLILFFVVILALGSMTAS